MSVKKERVDVLLVEWGFIEMCEKVKCVIMVGFVYVNEMRFDKLGEKIL